MLVGPGTLIAGRYVVERKIGEGSWGEVWAGRHVNVGMTVALKVLLDAKARSHDAVVRFKREAKFLGRIQSDYVARVLDFVDEDVYGLVLVMELVRGDSLADLLRIGPLTVDRAVEIGHDLAGGLCDLHAARVIHRDLKPGNVILRPLPDGRMRAVIIDFSMGRLMARAGEAESSITQLTLPAMSMGTLPYMAPEQVLDSRRATLASDIYAVGAILYRCLGDRYIFDGADDVAIARKKVSSEAPPLGLDASDPVAVALERAIMRAVRRRPEDRYPDANEMLRELGGLRDLARARVVDPKVLVATGTGTAKDATTSYKPTDRVVSPAGASPVRGRGVAMSVAAVVVLGAGVVLGVGVSRAMREEGPGVGNFEVRAAGSEGARSSAGAVVGAVEAASGSGSAMASAGASASASASGSGSAMASASGVELVADAEAPGLVPIAVASLRSVPAVSVATQLLARQPVARAIPTASPYDPPAASVSVTAVAASAPASLSAPTSTAAVSVATTRVPLPSSALPRPSAVGSATSPTPLLGPSLVPSGR